MLHAIRSATQSSHVALETALALLAPPIPRMRFVHALSGFHAFHRVWEPRMEALIDDPALLVSRRKLALLERDLTALGVDPDRWGAAEGPHAGFDLEYLDSVSAAWGSLYVLEGSSLGGQVISKALRGVGWLPHGGLAYFNPYGRSTAVMWRTFCEAIERCSADLDADAAIDGARSTFAALELGLTPLRAAA